MSGDKIYHWETHISHSNQGNQHIKDGIKKIPTHKNYELKDYKDLQCSGTETTKKMNAWEDFNEILDWTASKMAEQRNKDEFSY